jgi:hypothetical protein
MAQEARALQFTQRAQGASGWGRGGEVLERAQSGDFLVTDFVAFGAELFDGSVDVLRGPQHDGVEDRPERAELVRHPVPVRLVDGAALAVAHVPGKLVAGFLRVSCRFI